MFVERPPMSQRSHIAQSGSSAIIECSAAWSVDEELRHLLQPRRAAPAPGGTRPPRSRSSSPAGRASTVSSVDWSRIDFFWYATTLLRHRDAAEGELEAAAALGAQRLLDRGVRLLLRLRVVVAVVRRDERPRGPAGRARARGSSRRGGGTRPLRGRSSTRARARPFRAPFPLSPRRRRTCPVVLTGGRTAPAG